MDLLKEIGGYIYLIAFFELVIILVLCKNNDVRKTYFRQIYDRILNEAFTEYKRLSIEILKRITENRLLEQKILEEINVGKIIGRTSEFIRNYGDSAEKSVKISEFIESLRGDIEKNKKGKDVELVLNTNNKNLSDLSKLLHEFEIFIFNPKKIITAGDLIKTNNDISSCKIKLLNFLEEIR